MSTEALELPPTELSTIAPASAADFRAARAEPAYLTLPDSGFVVQVKRAHIAELAMAGAIPDHLSGYVLRRLGVAAGGDEPAPAQTLQEQLAPNIALIDAVCCAVLEEPRMVPAGSRRKPDQLQPDDMAYRDREYVYLWACRLVEASGLRRFPGGPGRGVEPVADGAGLPGAAE